MISALKRSISRKLMLVVLATTSTALLLSAAGMLLYEIGTYQKAWVSDLTTQAEILARVSGPALAFNDPKAAQENLALLESRPQILAAAIYAPDEVLFAIYSSGRDDAGFPRYAGEFGHRVEGGHISIFHPIVENRELVGTVYLRARYELMERLQDFIRILAVVTICSLLLAALLSAWLQGALTKPILAITDVARNVMQRRDFSLRAQKTTSDEIGVLVDALNEMLSEVDQRTAALEETNRTLAHEMAERRVAEQALRIADRRKDEFLATLAHELRNPLAPLVSGLEILGMDGTNPARAIKARDIMERQVKQMVRLVDDLLDISRITTGKLVIRKEHVDLQTVVHNAVETVAAIIEKSRHQLEVALPDQPVYLLADATRLSQVFANLLNNAAKYTNPGGQIALRAQVLSAQVTVEVSDNGIGIDADMQREIWKMFTQVDGSIERSHAGLGVGLTLARHLVELHGGTIAMRSEGKGKGSVFIVSLPVIEAPAARSAEDVAQDLSTSSCRVLLVDDNVDFSNSMADLLRGRGHTVQVAHDGESGLAAAIVFRPDFALLDIGLPRLNGYELARRLRQHPATRGATLVAITGWGQDKDRELAREAGFEQHLVKPVESAQILAILHKGKG